MLRWVSGCVSVSLSTGRVSIERQGANESEWTPPNLKKAERRKTDVMMPSDIQPQ